MAVWSIRKLTGIHKSLTGIWWGEKNSCNQWTAVGLLIMTDSLWQNPNILTAIGIIYYQTTERPNLLLSNLQCNSWNLFRIPGKWGLFYAGPVRILLRKLYNRTYLQAEFCPLQFWEHFLESKPCWIKWDFWVALHRMLCNSTIQSRAVPLWTQWTGVTLLSLSL